MIPFVAFSLGRAWQGFWRNALMSLAATLTMVLMLTAAGRASSSSRTCSWRASSFVEQKVEVVAYVQTQRDRGPGRRPRGPDRRDARDGVGGVRQRARRRSSGSARRRRRRAARTSPSTSRRTRCTRASTSSSRRRPDLGAVAEALRDDPIVRNVLNIEALVDRVIDRDERRPDRGRRDARRRRRDRAVHHRQHDPAGGRRPGRGDRDHAPRRARPTRSSAGRSCSRARWSGCSGALVTLGLLVRGGRSAVAGHGRLLQRPAAPARDRGPRRGACSCWRRGSGSASWDPGCRSGRTSSGRPDGVPSAIGGTLSRPGPSRHDRSLPTDPRRRR